MNLWLYLLLINVFAFGLYWADKRAAIRRGWRIPEANLLLVGFIGGTLGALAGQQVLRHKTRKGSFQMAFWAVTILQVYLLVAPPAVVAPLLARLFH